MSNAKQVAAALRRLERLKLKQAFSPSDLEAKPNAIQEQVLKEFGLYKQQWIRAGNQSGKTVTCARILTWVLTNTHPYWKRPAHWGEEPILAVVAGKTGKQIEDSLLPKIIAYLEPGTYKLVRIGNVVQRIEIDNGARVVFQSLENPKTAAQRLQSYSAHIAWVDELPPILDIIRELLIRVQAKDGYFLASFTPTIRSVEVQQYVDNIQEPLGKVYRFNMLDNPLYQDPKRRQELIDQYANLPEHIRNAIFKGDWLTEENSVYYFDYRTMVRDLPETYTSSWRHVVSVDPALSSALGLVVAAEDPNTKLWYVIKAKYISGILVPTDIEETVHRETSSYNVTKRISDPHEVWFIQTAKRAGRYYRGVYKKTERKSELIKNFQQALGANLFITPECTDLIQEIQDTRWSDTADNKIVNGKAKHLGDSCQYLVDELPKPEKQVVINNWDTWLYEQNEIRKVKEARAEAQKLTKHRIRRRRG